MASRILFLTPQLPYPPRQGTQIRNFHLLRAAASAHSVDLLSFAREGEALGGDSPLRELCGRVELLPAPRRIKGDRLRLLLTSPEPDMAHRLPSQDFAATLRAMLEGDRYAAIQVAGIEMAGYIPVARAVVPRTPIVFDDHNAEYLLQARAAAVDARHLASWPRAAYSLVQWLKLKRYEARVCATANAVLAVSEADATALRSLGVAARIRVVPNGVDTDYYRPNPDSRSAAPLPPNPATLLFTGTMDYRPNVDAMGWFVSAVLPAVAARKPEIRLLIVGRSPAPWVRALASRHDNVMVTGPVEDVRPYFRQSALFIVPIRVGGGSRLKILEALAMGLPVVSTSMGAEGIDLVDGQEIMLADGAEGFAAAILQLLDDPSLRDRMAPAGRRAAQERFDWSRVAPRLLEAYREVGTVGRGDGQS